MSGALRKEALTKTVERAMHHHRAKDFARAEDLYRQVLAVDGTHLVATHLLSAVLLETGRNEDAVALLAGATARLPRHAVFFANLGEAQRRLERYAEAGASLKRAIALKPDLAEAHHTLGLVLHAEERAEEAAASFGRALSLKPDLTPAHLGLAGALYDLGRFDESRAACERAIEVHPESADAYAKLGVVLTELGRLDEAFASYRRALACDPNYTTAHSNLVFALPFHPDTTAPAIAREARQWAERHAAAHTALRRPHDHDRDPERPLRVGYVSPDFRRHCQALFFVPLVEHHDRRAVDVHCYSLVGSPDDITERIRSHSTFTDVAKLDDRALLETIRRDRIDVLVDLTMHMAHNRLWLFAARPAPVQVAWLAYPGTTGLPGMDYRITDWFLDPPGADLGDYSEHSVRLPDSFWCYDPLTRVPEVNPLPASSAGAITFGCLNSYKKTNARTFSLWAEVLRAVEGSRFVLLAPPGDSRARARRAFAEAGVDPERIEFVEHRPRAEYLATYGRIDVCLDTFPSNGHTTSLDAHWMGVPVVTLVGTTTVARAGLCYAHNLGLPELATTTPEEFVRVALELARNRSHLAELRASLRGRMEQSPLMDAPRFAHHLESAYRWMWRRWCETPETEA